MQIWSPLQLHKTLGKVLVSKSKTLLVSRAVIPSVLSSLIENAKLNLQK